MIKKRRKRRKPKKEKMSKLTKFLIIIGIFDLAFIITMIVIFLITGQEMSTLISCVLGASGVEAIVSAVIKITNIKSENKQTEIEEE